MNADVRYFLHRASQESIAAERAEHPRVRQIHLDMAEHYLALADAVETHERRSAWRGTWQSRPAG